jgi:hypothetical protein
MSGRQWAWTVAAGAAPASVAGRNSAIVAIARAPAIV